MNVHSAEILLTTCAEPCGLKTAKTLQVNYSESEAYTPGGLTRHHANEPVKNDRNKKRYTSLIAANMLDDEDVHRNNDMMRQYEL